MEVLATFLIELVVLYFWDRVLGLPLPRRFWRHS